MTVTGFARLQNPAYRLTPSTTIAGVTLTKRMVFVGIEALNQLLLVGALLMCAGILFGAFSSRIGIPFLLVFLITGMLAGEDGLGAIEFDDYRTSLFIGNLALAVILFDGGLRTRMASFRVALKPSLVLATIGVLCTAALTGVFATLVLGIDWRLGLLLGAIVSSTDAAAVFALLKSSGTRLNDRVSSTLEIESGINDPAAIFLTILGIQLILMPGEISGWMLARELVQQFGLGFVLGLSIGWVAGWGLTRVRVGEGLHALLLCSAGVAVFALVNLLGGSGFLAVYLAGLMIGNNKRGTSEDVLRAMDGMAWLAQSVMFLILGLLVTPSDLPPLLLPACAVAVFLILIGRPLAVWAVLWPFRFSRREVSFISWVGLRGAVPIVLSIFPLMAGVPGALLIFNVAFVVVLASLVIQGTSIPWVAARLGVSLRQHTEALSRVPLHTESAEREDLLQFKVGRGADVEGVAVHRMQWPAGVDVMSVFRRGERLVPASAGALQAGDVVLLIAAADQAERLAERFDAHEGAASASWHRPGDMVLAGDAPLFDVLSLYGGAPEPFDPPDSTLADAIARRIPNGVVEGDWVEISGFGFRVVQMEHAEIRKVDIRLLPARR